MYIFKKQTNKPKTLIYKDTCSSMFIAALFNCLQLIPSGWSTRSMNQKSPAHLFVIFSFMVLPCVHIPLGRACTSSSFLQDPTNSYHLVHDQDGCFILLLLIFPFTIPDEMWYCYAQVAKSPNDHQGANIRCKSKRVFITKLELGLPPILTQWL